LSTSFIGSVSHPAGDRPSHPNLVNTKKILDADPKYLPDHVLFKIGAKAYNSETKQNYPFATLGNHVEIAWQNSRA
jgi:hypothetical protein